ncbi:MAG: 2TM domain-containing protein [Kordia sp.]|uniref:2TM domain-containing protein n=1 Tax=Kordia sp. TaxID=1965332 RepID=UPI00385C2DDA
MNSNNYDREREERYVRAQKRVENIRGFYVHLIVYICVNIFISYRRIAENMEDGATFQEAFLDIETHTLWLAWGIGMAFHAYNTFVKNGMLGSGWEARKIEEYMDEEERKSGKNEYR